MPAMNFRFYRCMYKCVVLLVLMIYLSFLLKFLKHFHSMPFFVLCEIVLKHFTKEMSMDVDDEVAFGAVFVDFW